MSVVPQCVEEYGMIGNVAGANDLATICAGDSGGGAGCETCGFCECPGWHECGECECAESPAPGPAGGQEGGTCDGADTTVQVRAPLAHPPRARPRQGSVALSFSGRGVPHLLVDLQRRGCTVAQSDNATVAHRMCVPRRSSARVTRHQLGKQPRARILHRTSR